MLESLQTPRAVSSTARRYPANALVGPLRRTNSVAARAPLVTLQDAAAYITALPKKEADTAEWQAAIESLMLVAEWAARQCLRAFGVMRALNRNVVREFNPDRKDPRIWGRQKLKL